MAVIRWEPLSEMSTLRRQMDRLFDELMQARSNSPEFTLSNGNAWVPAVEVKETDAEVVLRAEIPGVEAKDLDVQVTQKAVAITGEHRHEKKSEQKGHLRSEFRYGKFQRVVPLPAQVQNDQVKAQLQDGILTLNLPKLEAEQRKVVKVTIGGEASAPAMTAATNSHTETENSKSANPAIA